jgi:hypothetical protein
MFNTGTNRICEMKVSHLLYLKKKKTQIPLRRELINKIIKSGGSLHFRQIKLLWTQHTPNDD